MWDGKELAVSRECGIELHTWVMTQLLGMAKCERRMAIMMIHLLGLKMSAIHPMGNLGGGESSSTDNSKAKGDGSDTGSRERAGHAIAWAPQLLGGLFSLSASATMHANYSVIFCKPPTFCWR